MVFVFYLSSFLSVTADWVCVCVQRIQRNLKYSVATGSTKCSF